MTDKLPPRLTVYSSCFPWKPDSLTLNVTGAGTFITPGAYEYLPIEEHAQLQATAVARARAGQLDEWIEFLTLAIKTERTMPLSARGEGAQDCRIDFISMLKAEKKKLLGPTLPKAAQALAQRENK